MTKAIVRHFPGLILLAVVLSPPPHRLGFPLPIRVEDALLPIGLFLALRIRKTFPHHSTGHRVPVVQFLLILAASGMVGTSMGVIVLGNQIIARDLMFVPQVIKFSLTYWISVRLLVETDRQRIFMRYVVVSAAVCGLIGMAQFWNALSINEWFSSLYLFESDEELLGRSTDNFYMSRVFGTSCNSNYFGVLLALFGCWLIALLLHSASLTGRLTYTWILAFVVTAGALTQSRGTIVIFGVILLMPLVMRTGMDVGRKLMWWLMISCGGAILVYAVVSSSALSERHFGSRLRLDSASTEFSYVARVRDFVRPIEETLTEPWFLPFGRGTCKVSRRTDSHNGYTWILQRFGLVGLGAYVAVIVALMRRGYWLIAHSRDHTCRLVALGAVLSGWTWILAEMSGNIFKDAQVMSVLLIALGWLQVNVWRCASASAEVSVSQGKNQRRR